MLDFFGVRILYAKPRVPLTLVEYPEHDQSKSFHSGLLRIPERRTSVVSEFRIRPRAGSERLIIVMLIFGSGELAMSNDQI